MTCRVLRCPEPSAEIQVVSEGKIRADVAFCTSHAAQVADGAPYYVDHQRQAEQLVVLMGEDMPLRYEQLGYRDHIASPDQVLVTLTLKRWDDSDELVKFVVPRSKAAEFTALVNLDRDN